MREVVGERVGSGRDTVEAEDDEGDDVERFEFCRYADEDCERGKRAINKRLGLVREMTSWTMMEENK